MRALCTEYSSLHPPMLRQPKEEQGFSVWLARSVPADDAPALARLQQSNGEVLARMAALGGKRYSPYPASPRPQSGQRISDPAFRDGCPARRRSTIRTMCSRPAQGFSPLRRNSAAPGAGCSSDRHGRNDPTGSSRCQAARANSRHHHMSLFMLVFTQPGSEREAEDRVVPLSP